MDELLLPQRKLKSLNITTKNPPSVRSDTDVRRKSSRIQHRSMYQMGTAGQQYVKDHSGNGTLKNTLFEKESRNTFEDLLTSKKCPIHELLHARHLVILASTSKELRRYFLSLNIRYRVSFHDFAAMVRAGRGYGIFESCALLIGEEDEIVHEEDVSYMCIGLGSPKTQISCTLISFSFQLGSEVQDKVAQDFLRAMKYPSLLPLETLKLEGTPPPNTAPCCMACLFHAESL